jgi:1-deoxy-D-xylulose-5-phosphate reductoisomerase
MQLPIIYALSYPGHKSNKLPKTSLVDLPPLTFSEIKDDRFPLFKLAISAGESGGLLPTVLNAANEAAIKLFLEEKILFTDMFRIIQNSLDRWSNDPNPDIETIVETNNQDYREVIELYS